MSNHKQVVLAVLDGFGIAAPGPGNAISVAKLANYNKLLNNYPNSRLTASGRDVGLKENEPGNSEAGHEIMGAGRTVDQDKMEILESIHNSTFFKNAAFVQALNHARKNRKKVHLIGLLSDERSGHMEPAHLEALLLFFKQQQFTSVFLHLFTDGRDTPPKSAENFLKRLHLSINNIGVGKIATIAGRYFGMDRAHNYNRLWKAYSAIVYGQGKFADNEYQAVQQAYQRGETDEFIVPTIIPHKDKSGKKVPVTVAEGDSIIFFNLRSDRARQLTKAFVQPQLLNGDHLEYGTFRKFKNLVFVTMTEFGTDLPVFIAYPTRIIYNSLPYFLERYADIHQLYISESEKFAHVTYFFHGNRSDPLKNEKRIRIDSKKVATFDLEPAMSVKEITDELIVQLRLGIYNFSLVNYPNADMLGHTGNIKAAVLGLQALDVQLGRLAEAVLERNGTLIITGDHGNVEQMKDAITNDFSHEHSINPVPFIVINDELKKSKITLRDGSLRDVAPTILELLNLPKPAEMMGISLLKK